MLLVAPLMLSTTMSSLMMSRTNTPPTGRIPENIRYPELENCSYCDPLFSSRAESWRPETFTKYTHPLYLIVSRAVTHLYMQANHNL